MGIGDTLTIAGFYAMIPNPDRKWWQLWRPRLVVTTDLQKFVVSARA